MKGGYQLLQESGAQTSGSAQRRRRPILYAVVAVSAIFTISFFCAFSPHHSLKDKSLPSYGSSASDHKNLVQCPANIAPPASPPASVNLWTSLTVEETTSIHDWLVHPSRDLNLTLAHKATLSDNSIFLIEVYRPAKADALAYLEAPAQSNLPARYSRVAVHFGGRSEAEGGPVIKDYLVGPLPIGAHTTIEELTGIYHREDIPYNARGFVLPTEMTPLLMSYMPRLTEVTKVTQIPSSIDSQP